MSSSIPSSPICNEAELTSETAPNASGLRLPFGRLIGWNEAAWAEARSPVSLNLRWPCRLSVMGAVALCIAAAAANASRTGSPYAVEVFYSSVALLFLPFAVRTLVPGVGRTEHLANLALLTAGLFVIRLIREPVIFLDHDEFLHWSTANAILEAGRLFSPNPLLPVSPLYPGLELATTALGSLSGLGVFEAAFILLFCARMAFLLGLFFTYERISGSARIAACGCLIYMGASTFLIFDTQFSYESLAVTFLVAVLLADARSASQDRVRHVVWVVPPLLAALAVTHHMTAYLLAVLLVGLAVLETLRLSPRRIPVTSLVLAMMALALPLVWSRLMGDPSAGYLGPVLASGIREAGQLLTFTTGRTLFVSEDGALAPLWQRSVAIAAVGLSCLGLLAGFLRALALAGVRPAWRTLAKPRALLGWSNSRLVLLTGLTLAFPLSMIFRLTRSGWEIGNRVGPFSFLGVGLVVAVGVAAYWQGRSAGLVRIGVLAAAGLCLVVGGIISAQGPRVLVPAHHRVSADAASIEPMGIAAAEWARAWLGEGNLFASDRINRLLLATYGRQDISTTLQDGLDTGAAILAPTFGAHELALLREGRIDYVSVDLRITAGLPVVGVYFDGGDADKGHRAPPRPEALQKFDRLGGVSRIFDDGFIVTYDVRALDAVR